MSYPHFGYYQNPPLPSTHLAQALPHSAPISMTDTPHSPSQATPISAYSFAPSFTQPQMEIQPLQAQQAIPADLTHQGQAQPYRFFEGPPGHPHPFFYQEYYPSLSDAVPPTAISSNIPSPIESTSTTTTTGSTSTSFTPLDLLPPGQTNWSPSLPDPSPLDSGSMTSKGVPKIHPPPNGIKPHPAPTRARRAAASKARSNINKYASTLRSPVRPGTSTTGPPSIASSTSSRPPSRAGSTIVKIPSLSTVSATTVPRPMHHTRAPPPSGGSSSITILLSPPPSAKYTNKRTSSSSSKSGGTKIRLTGCRPDGQLLPAPEGSHLEVNDLLILHPPGKPPGQGGMEPMNQYSQAPCPEGYKSAFEMYTCRVCAKTYDGKNARSVARRHLQDKHNVPLALQERRTRWDGEVDRPKNEAEVRDRNLRSKRDWAQRARQHIRLERLHAAYLEQFGQKGVCPPCKTHLIAPSLRVTTVSCVENPQIDKHHVEWREVPKMLRDALAEMNGTTPPVVDLLDEVYDASYRPSGGATYEDSPYEENDHVAPLPIQIQPGMALRKKALTRKRGKSASISSASIASTSTQSALSEYIPPSPGRMGRSYSMFGQTHSPISHARSASTGQIGVNVADIDPDIEWEATWGGTTHVDDRNLQIAIAQHFASVEAAEARLALGEGVEVGDQAGGDESETMESPEPLYTIQEQSQNWSEKGDELRYPSQTYTYSTATPVSKAWLGDGMVGQEKVSAIVEDAKDDDDEHETVVAESLLNLHSTPARPDDHIPSRPSQRSDLPASSDILTQTASSVIRSLLDAPEIPPRPARPVRARSFVQPFPKGRPDSMTRSLSFTENHADDPFAFTPSSNISSGGAKKRRSTVASPSPLTSKRKKNEGTGSPVRLPMSILRPNAPISALSSHVDSNTANIGGQPYMSPFGGVLGAAYTTPIRPSRGMGGLPGSAVPSSMSRVWQFSSPGDPGAAASLGLVPQWGSGTPGMSGMVGSDTPNLRR